MMNFDWNRARAFLITAEEGSFSAAARALRSTQPTVGRQVAGLEEELGVTLFERVGTRLELTVSGLELLEHVRAMGDAANRTSLVATGQSESVEGNVSITASEAIAAFCYHQSWRSYDEVILVSLWNWLSPTKHATSIGERPI